MRHGKIKVNVHWLGGILPLIVGGLALVGVRPLAAAATSFGNEGTIQILVLPVLNQTKVGGDALAKDATRLFVSELAKTPTFSVIGPESLEKPEEANGLTQEGLVEVGKSAKADWVARLRLSSETVGSGSRAYNVLVLSGEATSVADGSRAARVYARGAKSDLSTKRKSVDASRVLGGAINETARQLSGLRGLRGVVGLKSLREGHVQTSLGSQTGLRPGAEVAFYDSNGQALGYGGVVSVDRASSLVRVNDRFSYALIQINTPVRAIYNPPAYVAGRTVAEQEDRERKREEIRFVSAVALALIGIDIYRDTGKIAAAATSPPPPPPPPP
ncbi:MAG: hypothetical protein HY318_13845, partial [Armatimonadetes bacterium]|nr:hypothetical protein [Armatimonadota bacterium]